MPETSASASPERQATAAKYGASYFLNYWGGGGPYERNERWLKFFSDVADGIVRDFHPTSVLDAGCAMGFLVEELRKRGVDASGIDISEYAISKVDQSVANHCRVASIAEPLDRRYDLITCMEVLEHLPPAEAGPAIENLCSATDRLLLSSTPGDFGEPTHLNVQSPEVWSEKLAQQGFFRDLEHDPSYISPWASLYARREESLPNTVRRYDRAWWRQRQEIAEMRKSLLQLQAQLQELPAEPESDPLIENRPELVKELDNRNEEILRLRDLLIGKDAELGATQGRLTELEERMKRITGAKARLEAGAPGFGTLTRFVLRLLRGNRS